MIIKSIFDTDLYKLSMQNFVLRKYIDAYSVWHFVDRNKNIKYTTEAFHRLEDEIHQFSNLKLQQNEYDWMKINIPYLDHFYRQSLLNYRFKPDEVKLSRDKNDYLIIPIEGFWHSATMWEPPLMATISEIYFDDVDTDWNFNRVEVIVSARDKAEKLTKAGCKFIDMGTRRRRNYETQKLVIETMKNYKGFVGTSNVHFSMMNNLIPKGTMAHEIPQAISVLRGLRHANRYTMEDWSDVYKGDLGTTLPDTFGTDAFLKDFELKFAKLFDSDRHDSGCPFKFTDKFINHYNNLKINPISKPFIYSNGLKSVEEIIAIQRYRESETTKSYGIGTWFTNDFMKLSNPNEISKALNMVIKLWSINGIPTVKLGERATEDDDYNFEKAIGDPDAIKVALWTFFGKSLS